MATTKTIDITKVKIEIATGSARDLIASWSGAKIPDHTESYEWEWRYYADKKWIDGGSGSTKVPDKTAPFTAPDNAKKVQFRIKPVSEDKKSDDKTGKYWEGDWSKYGATFSAWASTKNPPAFKIQTSKKGSTRDEFQISAVTISGVGDQAIATFKLKKSRMASSKRNFITYLDGFDFSCEGSTGPQWSGVESGEIRIVDSSYNDVIMPIHGENSVTITDAVRTKIRNDEELTFACSFSLSSAFRVYRFTVTPRTNNEYAFLPIASFVEYVYVPGVLKWDNNFLDVEYDAALDTFVAKWSSRSHELVEPELYNPHITGFAIEWRYMKQTVDAWNMSSGGSYPEEIWAPATADTVEIGTGVIEDKDYKVGLNEGLMSFGTKNRTWTYSFQLPQGSWANTPVEFRIKVTGDGAQDFKEEWGDWFLYSNYATSRSVSRVITYKPTSSSRKIEARWVMFDVESVSGFNVDWYYQTKTDPSWISGQSGTVDISRTKDGVVELRKLTNDLQQGVAAYPSDVATVSSWPINSFVLPHNPTVIEPDTGFYDTTTETPVWWYIWSFSMDVPVNATAIMVEVTPVPSTSYAFIGEPYRITYDVSVPTRMIDSKTVTISVYDAEQRQVVATWPEPPNVDLEDLASYEVIWEYKYEGIWYNGQSGNPSKRINVDQTDDVVSNSSIYTVPQRVDDIRFTVRPMATSEDIFVGAWCSYVPFRVKPSPLILDARYITIETKAFENRTLIARFNNVAAIPDDAWPAGTQDANKQIIFEWSYVYDGQEYLPDEISARIDYCYTEWTYPGNEDWHPDEVRVRVKVDVANIRYLGDWSGSTVSTVYVPSYTITDIDLSMFNISDRTALARWDSSDQQKLIGDFDVEWRYWLNDQWFPPQTKTVAFSDISTDHMDTLDVPLGVGLVKFRVKANPKYELDFYPNWSNEEYLEVPDDDLPEIPSAPELTLLSDGYSMIVRADITDLRTDHVDFYVENQNGDSMEPSIDVVYGEAVWQFTGIGGSTYRAKVRAFNEEDEYRTPEYGDYASDPDGWSPWSNEVATRPAPVSIQSAKAINSTEIRVEWADPNAGTTRYIIERANKDYYFDASPDRVTSSEISDPPITWAIIAPGDSDTGIWYFRVAAVRGDTSSGDLRSEWSGIISCALGKPPTAPTTWSNKINGMVGDDIYLYWNHNSQDNSSETYAQIEIKKNGGNTDTITDQRDEDNTSQRSYKLPNTYTNSEATIEWRVRTMGAPLDGDPWSPWSTQRIIKIYTAPVLTMTLGSMWSWSWDSGIDYSKGVFDLSDLGTINNLASNQLTAFPLVVRLKAAPLSQDPIAYSITVVSNSSYTTTNSVGDETNVYAGATIFRRTLVTSKHEFATLILPSDISLENGMSYTINANVSMSSGLSAETNSRFSVSWDTPDYDINAELTVDEDKIITYIRPYCTDDNDAFVPNVEMAVYRREFDGRFTKIGDHIRNEIRPSIVDPHPNLDYARYRIVAMSLDTGRIQYTDLPPRKLGIPHIFIQWDEKWSAFTGDNEGLFVERPWTGSQVKLPYNIDTSDSNTADVEMIEYIGRDHPVSYYGTQVGQKATWSCVIPATDKQTIYDLRRLARYMGNAYVREPSGTGYWAHVEVSFNITHLETVIPVSLSITRVEGGM